MTSYKYLFPFEKIERNSRIIIYGAGVLGQEYLEQIAITQYCKVVAMIDKNAERYDYCEVPVYVPQKIKELQFDYVVIAIRTETAYKEIKRILCGMGVRENRIVCVFERKEPYRESFASTQFEAQEENQKAITISFFTNGGIGDMITHKKFITQLIAEAKECDSILYAARERDFVEFLYSDVSQVNEVIDDAGVLYEKRKKQYDLAVMITGMSFVKISFMDETKLKGKSEQFYELICKLKEASEKDNFNLQTPLFQPYYQRMYRGENCYTYLSYGGVLNIHDKQVTIPLADESMQEFMHLNLKGNYITFNYGNGDAHTAKGISKAWPKENFDSVVKLVKERYPRLQVVQLGAANAEQIIGADRYILGKPLKTVCQVLKNSILHIDIEGGLVHIATQLGTKCIVLFGPTMVLYVGYESNINISAGDCHDCYGLYPDNNKCARNMEKPECMYAIKPQMVFDSITAYLNNEMV